MTNMTALHFEHLHYEHVIETRYYDEQSLGFVRSYKMGKVGIKCLCDILT